MPLREEILPRPSRQMEHIELAVSLATGLLIVCAAFLALLAIHMAVVTPETDAALQMFEQ